jgi:hypothetical protein
MACIVKVGNEFENLSGYNTFIKDTEPNSQYFRVSKFQETFTAGKNLFLMEGSPYLKESTAVKIEIVDVEGNTLYVEPGRGVPDYYEGNSVVLSTHVYDNMPVGPAKITVLGELKEYIDNEGILRPIPEEWKGAYNVKWERNFYINKNIENSTPVIFYKRPIVTIEETEGSLVQQDIPTVTQSGSVKGTPEIPELGTDIRTWRAGTLYRLDITNGPGFTGSIDENIISIPSLGYSATVKEVLNKNTVLVDKPYLVDNKIAPFPSSPYTTTFEYFDGRTSTDTIVTGSYQRLVFKNIETFTGNLDKVKIFRKSRSDISDFKFLEEVKVQDITSDLLVDPTSPASEKTGGVGRFTENTFATSWTTSSLQISGSDTFISFDDDLLYESIKINVPSSSLQTEPVNIVTNTEFDIFSGVDYEVSVKTLVSGSAFDTIPGEITIVSESVSTTTYYLYDPNVMSVYPVSFRTSTGYNSILIQSSSQDLTRNYIYDNTRLTFFDTPQNTTGSSLTSIDGGFTYDTNINESITFDTTSGDWGNTSNLETTPSNNANVVSTSTLLGSVELNVMVWLDSGSYTIPMSGNPQDVSIYTEVYSSGSSEVAILSLENIGGDAKFYYYNSNTQLNNLQSFRNSTEYDLEPIDTNDYTTPQSWHTSGTGSQVIIPFEQSGYNYVHIDYRTSREIEPLNAELIDVQRLDRLNGDVLYGESYDITSMNFNTGEIEFSDGTDADFSGTLNIQNGQLVLTIDGDTQYAYLVEADFNNSVMVFIGRIDVGDMEPSSTRYNLYDLFQLSGSTVQNTSTSSFSATRVPTQGGDYLYTENGYPLTIADVSSRDFLTPIFDSPSSSLEFVSPLEIPYIFRNDGGEVTDVYTFDSSSGQIYNASSVSSSSDINSDSYVYDNVIIQQGFVPSGSIHDDISTTDSNLFVNDYVNLTFNQHDHLSGSVIVSLLTDSGSVSLPTDTGSVEYHIESFVSESGYLSGNTIWRNAMAFRNFNTDGMMFYNHSSVSQSAVEAISGSLNYQLSPIDTNDFQTLPLNMLESGSQAILDFELSGSGYNFIYLDYRTNRTRQVLNADLEQIGLVSSIDGNPIGTAIDTLSLSGSEATSITSASYYTQQVPPTTSSIFYATPSEYPFFPTTIPAGNYIGDKTQPGVTETILNSPLNIPYVLNISDSTPNEVIVQRLDAIYTASSAYGTTGTAVASPPVFVSKSLVDPPTIVPKTLKLYVTGSSGSADFKEYLADIKADTAFSSRQDISNIITSTYEGSNVRLGIEARGDGWQVAKLNLKPATAKGFSPKIFKTVQEEDRNLQDETFDYNFEMYDVNNNYIPVKLQETVRFTQGNKQTLGTLKLLTFESDRTAFRFYSGSIANPPFQQIRLIAQKQNVSGSITYASAAFDSSGQYIEPSSYSGTYPGGLTSVGENGGIVTIANFSGSDTNYEVGSIIYTASVDGLTEFETIFRLEDGLPTSDLIVNNNRSVFTYKLSDGSLNPPNQNSTITVKRKNLASNTETITANSSSAVGTPPPLVLVSDNSTTGVATYFLSGSSLDLATGSVQYEFSASDAFGLQVDNVTTVTPISFLEGVVLYLSNERGVLPAYYNGVIPSSSYVYTSGSTKLYVGGDEVTYSNSGGNNTYKITGVTGSGITPNEVTPTTNNYGGVPGTMLSESSSLQIDVRYIDSSGESYDFGRTANFNIIREGEAGQPGLEGSNGPGLVFTGLYDTTRDYIRTSGSLARADSVLYNNTFYLAITSSGPSYGGFEHPSSSAEYWESLGTASRFVAAELGIFAESYVQNTINVGTNNSGSTSAANITIAGGTNYPWISIGQSGQTGTQGYNVGNGIFLGINGNSGTASLSLESPILGGNELLWDGENLSIKGSITVTNTQDFITPTDTGSFTKNESTSSLENPTIYSFGPDASFTLEGVTPSTSGLYLGSGNMGYYDSTTSSWNTYMDDIGRFYLGGTSGALQWDGSQLSIEGSIAITAGATKDKLDGLDSATGSLESSVSQINDTTASLQNSVDNINTNSGSWVNPTSYNFGPNGGPGFDLVNIAPGSTAGLYLGQDNLGYHDGTNWNTYMDESGNFYLGGSSNGALSWNGTTLNIEGNITVTNTGDFAPTNAEPNDPNQDNPSTYAFGNGAGAFDLKDATAATGLNLTSKFLGYYDGVSSQWKSYMDNAGNFYLGGSSNGALSWNGTQLSVGGNITATTGNIAGFIINGSDLESTDGTFLINGGSSPEIKFINSGVSNVIINNSTQLTPTSVITPPSFSGTITTTTSNQITDFVDNGSDEDLSVSSTTITTKSNNVTMTINDTLLEGVSAQITAVLVPGGGTDGHIKSFVDRIFSSIDYHQAAGTLYCYLYKDSVLIETKTFSVNDFNLPNANTDSTLILGGNRTAVFNVVLSNGSTYEIRTGIGPISSYASLDGVNPAEPSESMTVDWYTPKISSTPSITISAGSGNQFTEISRGGLQVVSSATKKILIPIDTNVSSPALEVFGSVEVNGDIDASGNITAFSTSDLRLKENIKLIPDALDKLKEINGVTFDWKEGFTHVHKFKGSDIGVIAQEVEYVLPHIVKQNEESGYRGVRYEKLTPLLIEAIKDLSKKVDNLEKEIKQLKG